MTSNSQRPSVALIFPFFAGGGAEAVALWAAQALQDDYKVTILTATTIDLDVLNGMYATQVKPDQVAIQTQFPNALARLIVYLRTNISFCKPFLHHYFIRWIKTLAKQFDVCFSGYNAMDMGCPGIQYIHWHDVLLNRNFYWLSKFSESRAFHNLSVSNSIYTAGVVENKYGFVTEVLYPPVPHDPDIEVVPWSLRDEFSFICSGRITKPKTPDRIIKILYEVRQEGFDVKLHLTGGGGGTYGDSYVQEVEALAREHSDWVTLHMNLPYQEYLEVLRHCRYGFHLKQEPFGISVAEIVQMGLIPFVRSRGGQLEIVGQDNPELIIADKTRAKDQIISVLRDHQRQQEILKSLEERRHLFTPERFMDGTKALVKQFLDQKYSR
ncbi:MAG: glycosyltransferase family 1 protein [Oscillatoriales cyanobacterium]|nr:MAG: glycosyltransferase family 1 protein [Oscillatoriales cyanobacterium]